VLLPKSKDQRDPGIDLFNLCGRGRWQLFQYPGLGSDVARTESNDPNRKPKSGGRGGSKEPTHGR
jgi:hypothetical protein